MANGGRRVKFSSGGAYPSACPAGIHAPVDHALVAELPLDLRDQLIDPEWLMEQRTGDVPRLVGGRVITGHQNHRHIGTHGFDRMGKRDAIGTAIRHHQVQKAQIDLWMSAKALQAGNRIRGSHDVEALVGQQPIKHFTDGCIVIHEQNCRHGSPRSMRFSIKERSSGYL